MKIKYLLFRLFFLFFITFTTHTYAESSHEILLEQELQTFNLKNPIQDLEKRIKEKDFRFIGLYGFTMYFPGIGENNDPIIDKYGTLPIKGTSDYIMSKKHSELIEQAQRYAKTYNTALISYIKDKSPPTPIVDMNCQKWELPLPHAQ